MKKLSQILIFTFALMIAKGAFGGGSSGTPTITDKQQTLLTLIQNQANQFDNPVLQVSDQQYIDLLTTFNIKFPNTKKPGILISPEEILIKDGMPVMRLSYIDRDRSDIYVLTPDYYKTIDNLKDFYFQIDSEFAVLPSIAP